MLGHLATLSYWRAEWVQVRARDRLDSRVLLALCQWPRLAGREDAYRARVYNSQAQCNHFAKIVAREQTPSANGMRRGDFVPDIRAFWAVRHSVPWRREKVPGWESVAKPMDATPTEHRKQPREFLSVFLPRSIRGYSLAPQDDLAAFYPRMS